NPDDVTLHDYTNGFEVPNDAGTDPLTAYFRFNVSVATESPCDDVTVDGLDIDPIWWPEPPAPPPPPPPPPPIPLSDGETALQAAILGTGLVGPILDMTAVMRGPDGAPDEIPIEIIELELVGNTAILVEINTIGAAGGVYDVVVTSGCGNVGVGEDFIEIIPLPTSYDCDGADTGYDAAYELNGTGTLVFGPGDDDGTVLVDLGFTFNYGEDDYTSTNIGTNGGIDFEYDETWFVDCDWYNGYEPNIWP
ncbi:MAG: hypothetical protein GY869_04435, partial [Planctomycetes bacterium]|nr:hypothetical protein [Planctomycetota bacterium]